MKTATLVLAWNGAEVLPSCLAPLANLPGEDHELICIDNGSSDASVEIIRKAANRATLIENGTNLGFAGGMNRGLEMLLAREQPPEAVLLLNQDTIVAVDWLRNITAPLSTSDETAAVGCKIHYPGGLRLQHAGATIAPARAITRHIGAGEDDRGQYDETREMSYVTGAALALRCSALQRVGLLDTGYHPAYYEDVDLCLRLRAAGFRIVYEPRAVVSHQESTSIPDAYQRACLTEKNRLRYIVKNYESARLWDEFLPAELAHLDEIGHGLELATLRRAYLDTILDMEEWIRARRRQHDVSEEEATRLRGLGGLLRRCISTNDATRAW
ncbi:MAG: glycosyltransferase family 2 protein [bacterium]